MEEIQQALSSRNIFVWIIFIVILVIILKLLKSAGKLFISLLAIFVIGLLIHHFFPGLLDPLINFVRGGWMGE